MPQSLNDIENTKSSYVRGEIKLVVELSFQPTG
jgi:hypothetical protein